MFKDNLSQSLYFNPFDICIHTHAYSYVCVFYLPPSALGKSYCCHVTCKRILHIKKMIVSIRQKSVLFIYMKINNIYIKCITYIKYICI